MNANSDRATQRAHMPPGAPAILERRGLASGNPGLADLLRPGLRVLDVGCGSGSITRDVARAVGPTGRVIGIDVNPVLIDRARARNANIPNVSFRVCDIRREHPVGKFDLAYAARVLQWITDPRSVVSMIRKVIVVGGIVQVYDYDHTAAIWQPELPRSMKDFYSAFLSWRADAGMDNRIARHLANVLSDGGLVDVQAKVLPQEWRRENPVEWSLAGMWADVAASRGHQMVRDGYITEHQRAQADLDYRSWLSVVGERHVVHLAAAWGYQPPGR